MALSEADETVDAPLQHRVELVREAVHEEVQAALRLDEAEHGPERAHEREAGAEGVDDADRLLVLLAVLRTLHGTRLSGLWKVVKVRLPKSIDNILRVSKILR